MMDRWVHTRVGRCIPVPLVGWMDGQMDRVMEMQAHTRGGWRRPGSQWVQAHGLAGHGHPWRWMPWVPSLARGSCCGRSPPRAGPAGTLGAPAGPVMVPAVPPTAEPLAGGSVPALIPGRRANPLCPSGDQMAPLSGSGGSRGRWGARSPVLLPDS